MVFHAPQVPVSKESEFAALLLVNQSLGWLCAFLARDSYLLCGFMGLTIESGDSWLGRAYPLSLNICLAFVLILFLAAVVRLTLVSAMKFFGAILETSHCHSDWPPETGPQWLVGGCSDENVASSYVSCMRLQMVLRMAPCDCNAAVRLLTK
jgi:hypothetical protein